MKKGIQRDTGDEPMVSIPLSAKRNILHTYISGNGNPCCIVEYFLPVDDGDGQDLRDQPSTSTAPESATPWTCSIPNAKRKILKKNKARRSIPSAAQTRKVVYHMQYNGCNKRGNGAASVHLKCQNCSGRQTVYCDASYIMPTKSGSSWMINPEKVQLFWHNAKMDPPGDHTRLSPKYEHKCRGLTRQKIAEITYESGILMRNRKRFYRRQMREEFKHRDERVPLVPKVLSTLNYHKRLDGEGFANLRWPCVVTDRFLIVADLLMLSRLPPASFIRMMLDGTFTISGDFRQCITIQIAITDDTGNTDYRLVAAIYLLSKKKLDYAAAFYAFWQVLTSIHDSSVISTVFAQTDGEMSLYLGAENGLKKHSVNVLSTICQVHLERALYRNLKSIIGFQTTPAAVRIFTFMMKTIQLVRPDLIMPSLLGLFALVQRLPRYGRRISRFLRDYCQRVMGQYRDRFCYYKLLLLAKKERSSVCLSTNPSESLNNSLNSQFRAKFKKRKGNLDEDLLLLYEFMDESGLNYYQGHVDKQREDENDQAANREAYVRKVMDRCEQEEIYERGMPFPREFFMDLVNLALERFAEKAPARLTAILRKRWARNRLEERLKEIEDGKVKAAEMDPETEEDRLADEEIAENDEPCDVPVGAIEDEIMASGDEGDDGIELNVTRAIGSLKLPTTVQHEMAMGDLLEGARAHSGAAGPSRNSDVANASPVNGANETQGDSNGTKGIGAVEHSANMVTEQSNPTTVNGICDIGTVETSANMETERANPEAANDTNGDDLLQLDYSNPFESESDTDIEMPPSTDEEDDADDGEQSEEDSIDWGFNDKVDTARPSNHKTSTSQALQSESDQRNNSSSGLLESGRTLSDCANRVVKFAKEPLQSKSHVDEFRGGQNQTPENASLKRKRQSVQNFEREDNQESKNKHFRLESYPPMAKLRGKKKKGQLRDFDRLVENLGDAVADVDPSMLTDAAFKKWPDKPLKLKDKLRHERAEEKALEGIPKVPGDGYEMDATITKSMVDNVQSHEQAETAFSPIRTRSRSKEDRQKSKKNDSTTPTNELSTSPTPGEDGPQRRMYKIVFTKAELMKCITDALVPLLPWAIFDLTPDGISVQSVDDCQNVLVQLVLRAVGMEEYSIDKPYALGVKVDLMAKYLKTASNDDKLTITGDDENGKMVMKFKSPYSPNVTKYSIKLIVFAAERCNISTTEYSSKITMPSSLFEQAIKTLSGVGDVAKMTVTPGKIVFSAKGDIGEVETEFDEKENNDPKNKLYTIEAQGHIELNYSSKYLEMMSRAASLADQVMMQLKDGVPMTITYNMKAG
ncbi:Oidioi.mRNA.OKI2018_I69.chr2.g7153.t1.cds [Oikopleura dioica]|uniref:DNA sliding clamp PCNA n=1 Tax=Oikopleura dioica TaxID=34765 RepID=A0ABN7TC81_OIKDI|nr:Oidioi.mRNA.OKI2018_I69.chr2.g7153.t1.cds [Oikopleura dioica]